MIGFLYGLTAGLLVSMVGFVSLLSAYPMGRGLPPDFYDELGYLILAMGVTVCVTGAVAMAKQVRADRRRERGQTEIV